jgi:peptidoglycan/xylan/chitin deacetylase (PgdA/CDA1 family)
VSAPKTRPATEPPAAGRAAEQPREKDDDDPEPAPPAATPPPAGASAAPVVTPTRRPDDGLGPGRSLRFTGSRTVALTFDDGPDPVHTPRILATLGQHRVRATFCLVGVQVERHPDIVRQIADAGHALCNHTWDHSLTIGKDKPEEIRADLDRTDAAIRAAVPGARIPFFRAPGGNFTDRLVTVAGEAGMTSLYWDVDPRDWEHPVGESPEAHIDRLVAEVRRTVRPGAIVLSHDFNQPGTVAAYEKLLPWLTERFRLGIPAVRRPEPAPSTPPAPSPSSPAATTAPPPQG